MLRLFAARSGVRSDAYRLLSLAVEEVYRVPCPDIARDAYGKPFFPSRPDICFSVSHTGGLVLAALDSLPCGCDAELIRPVRPAALARVCAPEELEEFTFMELWTLKESLFKLLGHTSTPFRQLVFRRSNGLILPPDPTLYARLYTLDQFQLASLSKTPPAGDIKYLHF